MFFLAPLLASVLGPSLGLGALGTGLLSGIASYAMDPKDPTGALLSGLTGGIGSHFMGGLGGAAKGAAEAATQGIGSTAAKAASSAAINHGAKATLAEGVKHALPGAGKMALQGGIGSMIKNPWLLGAGSALASMAGSKGVKTPADKPVESADLSIHGKPRNVVRLGGNDEEYGTVGGEHSFFPDATMLPKNPTDWIDDYPEIKSVMKPGGIYGLRKGGMVTGPGGPTDDKVPAVNVDNGQPYALSNGEVVMNANAAKAIGYDNLAAINRQYEGGEEPIKLFAGGTVGGRPSVGGMGGKGGMGSIAPNPQMPMSFYGGGGPVGPGMINLPPQIMQMMQQGGMPRTGMINKSGTGGLFGGPIPMGTMNGGGALPPVGMVNKSGQGGLLSGGPIPMSNTMGGALAPPGGMMPRPVKSGGMPLPGKPIMGIK